MVKTMSLNEVRREMKKLDERKNPIPFSIKYRTFNSQNGFGGKVKFYPKATYMNPPKKKGILRLADKTAFKNPNHFKNHTRNIKTPEGIKKVNVLFIIEFNGYQVEF